MSASRRWAPLAIALLALLAATPTHAAHAAAGYPLPDGYVVDVANALSPATEDALELELREYETRTTNQIAVAVVPSLEGRTVEDYAAGLFDSWGVGQAAADNGVLLLVATEDRKLRIEVGAGLLRAIPDEEAASIVEREIVPRLRAGDIEGGVRSGTIGIRRALDDDVSTPDDPPGVAAPGAAPVEPQLDTAAGDDAPTDVSYPGGGGFGPSLFVLLIPLAVMAFVVRSMAGGRDQCPSCGRALAWGGPASSGGYDQCRSCGFARRRFTRGVGGGVGFGGLLGATLLGSALGGTRWDDDDRSGDRGSFGGSDSGGGSSGSGGGGSFGGGSSGGGGASGSW